MPTVAKALGSVFLRLLAAIPIMAVAVIFSFFSALLGPGGGKGLFFITAYALLSWMLLPLCFVTYITTTAVAILWGGVGIFSFINSTPGATPLFAHWSIVSAFFAVSLLLRYVMLHEQQNSNTSEGDSHTTPSP